MIGSQMDQLVGKMDFKQNPSMFRMLEVMARTFVESEDPNETKIKFEQLFARFAKSRRPERVFDALEKLHLLGISPSIEVSFCWL